MKLEKMFGEKVRHITLLSCLMLFGFIVLSKAEPVDVEKAKAVALAQMRKEAGGVSLRSGSLTTLDLVYESKNETNQPYFYVFAGNKGFTIVSGDDRVEPILGYSDDGYFDPNNIPPNMAEFLKGFEKYIDNTIKKGIKAELRIQAKWNSLEKNVVQTRSYTKGNYLIKTTWGQGWPYNDQCPIVNSVRSFTGCYPLAMAQILRYWGKDKGIAPTHGFNGFEDEQYDYTNMPEALNGTMSQDTIDAVAKLVYHCGIASHTRYSIDGTPASGATTENVAGALINKFGYSNVELDKRHLDSIDLKNLLKSEFDKGQPVIYSVGIHAFICDGYDEQDYFHMNWGYGGSGDGWFTITLLKYDNFGDIYDYSFNNGVEIIYNIYPVRDVNISEGNRPVIYVAADGTGDGSSWANARPDLHNVVQENFGESKQIWVKKGVYYGNTIAGANSAAFIINGDNRVYGGFEGYETRLEERKNLNPSILDGQNLHRVLCQLSDFQPAEISLWDGFTIRNGLINSNDISGNGGGVYLKKNGILRYCIIDNCRAVNGGGVFNNGGKVLSCSFNNNQATKAGALYNSLEGEVQLSNSLIEYNRAIDIIGNSPTFGGAIYNSGQLYIYENTFIRNNNAQYGGGIYSNGFINIASGIISQNTGEYGAGIYSDGDISMSGGVISYNEASLYGGGINATNGNYLLNGGKITNNTSNNNGGGIAIIDGSFILRDSIKIQGNSAIESGGGIYFSGGTLNLISGMIGIETNISPENKQEALGSGGNYAKNGGGIYVYGNSSRLNYTANTFLDDYNMVIGGNLSSENGGGIYQFSNNDNVVEFRDNIIICGNKANIFGGGIYAQGRLLKLNGCSLLHNKANKGGGIFSVEGNINHKLYITGQTSIRNNEANEGGGIYSYGSSGIQSLKTFNISGGEIHNNNAEKGSGIYNYCNSNFIISDSAKINDTIYLQKSTSVRYDYEDLCNIQPNSLTYHINSSFPIMVELGNMQTSIIAKYNTPNESANAVNNNVFSVVNYGWRPVANSVYVKLEQYTPIVVAKNVIYITPEGTGDGSSWAKATNNLYGEMMKDRTVDTMQIWVKYGTYNGNTTASQGRDEAAFKLGKRNKVYGGFAGNESSLEARSLQNPSILDGQKSRRVIFQLTDFADIDSSFIDGFTIVNGIDMTVGTANIKMNNSQAIQSGSDMAGNGGGVYLRKNGILRNCIIDDCKAISGGGVFNYGGKVIDCSFTNNEANHAGGLFNSGITSLSNCTISNNKTLYAIGTNMLGYGGGVYNVGALYIYENVFICNNKGIVGNGFYNYNSGIITMNGGKISENTGGEYGGGIYNDGTVVINNGCIENNQASQGGGITTHGSLSMYGGIISKNVAGSYGGGICNSGTLNIAGSTVRISGNQAGSSGGGIYIYDGVTTISAGIIGTSTNTAPSTQQEAIEMGGNVSLGYLYGGGISVVSPNILIYFVNNGDGNIVIGGNYAYEGGGIYTKAPLTLTSNVFVCGNTSSSSGGGIRCEKNLTLNGCNISYNKSMYYGGGISQSGNLYLNEGTIISYNKASNSGGGIGNVGYLYMSGGEISNNEAINKGGAIYNYGSGSINIYGGKVSGNNANMGDGVYNSYKFSLYGSVNMADIIYIPDDYSAINLSSLTYHTDNTKPITIQGGKGYKVVSSSLAQSYVDNGIIVSTSGYYPVALNNSVYLYLNGTRSGTFNPITDNDNAITETISVYPSLISKGEMLSIESPDRGSASILNMSGIIVGQHKLESGITKILTSYPSGFYIVKINTDIGEEKVVKIIVK